jgi:Ribonuclease HI
MLSICSDSRAAIAALARTANELALVWECTYGLEKLSGSKNVALLWIPRYHGMPGNKEADKLAKEGTDKFPCDQTAGIPFAVCKEASRSHLCQEHMER